MNSFISMKNGNSIFTDLETDHGSSQKISGRQSKSGLRNQSLRGIKPSRSYDQGFKLVVSRWHCRIVLVGAANHLFERLPHEHFQISVRYSALVCP